MDKKIAVYAIMKDEQKFYDNWLKSMWDSGCGAYYICVLDTGSGGEWEKEFYDAVDKNGIPRNRIRLSQKKYENWRFDIPRNDSMKLIPSDADFCVCTDLDETLISGWAKDMKECISDDVGRVYYNYSWNGNEELNDPKRYFLYDKTHKNEPSMVRWDYPVHEALHFSDEYNKKYPRQNVMNRDKIYLWHHADASKSRSSYLPLLELRAKENKDDNYGLFYLAREYTFIGDWESAYKTASQLEYRLKKNKANDDYCMLSAVYVLLGDALRNVMDNNGAEIYYSRCIKEYPSYRDGYIKLAQLYAYTNNPIDAFNILVAMEEKTQYIKDWRVIDYYWRKWKINQIKADAFMWMKKYESAFELMTEALSDIKTEQDVCEARSEGFYADYEFLLDLIGRGEKKSESDNSGK